MSPKIKVLLVVLLAIAVVVVITLVRLRAPVAPAGPAEVHPDGDAGVRTFGRDAWLDSCLGACRASGPRRLPHLSPEKRLQYCSINCECGLEKMTEPSSKPGEVRAPSAAWMKMTEQQQMDAAQECQKRSEAMTANHPPDGAP
jgi:hypothetical protein